MCPHQRSGFLQGMTVSSWKPQIDITQAYSENCCEVVQQYIEIRVLNHPLTGNGSTIKWTIGASLPSTKLPTHWPTPVRSPGNSYHGYCRRGSGVRLQLLLMGVKVKLNYSKASCLILFIYTSSVHG